MADDELTLKCYGGPPDILTKFKDAYIRLGKNNLKPTSFNLNYSDAKSEASITLNFDEKTRLPDESKLKGMLCGLGFSEIRKK